MTTIALLTWPLITLVLVLTMPFPKAAMISILGGFFLLPPDVGINLPVLPTLSKDSVPALSLLVLAVLFAGRRRQQAGQGNGTGFDHELPQWLPLYGWVTIGLFLVGFGAFLTALVNGDRISYGSTVLPGMRPYDGLAQALTALTMLVPLFLGRRFFAHPDNQALLIKAFIIGGLIYSLPTLYEVRMSPQLNRQVYGFYSSGWVQNIRGGGWRPSVFTDHGLQLAMFFAMVSLAAFGAARFLRREDRGFYIFAGVWCLGTLWLSNSLGALIIAVVFLPVVLFLGARLQLLFAAMMAAAVLLYPVLRSTDIVPAERLVSIAQAIHPGRAVSLQFRLAQEDILLEHAEERPLLGWGGWRRNRVFNEEGQDISTTDGAWIITFGRSGWVGYVGLFGLLTMPVVLLAITRRRDQISPTTVVVAVTAAASFVDLIPNGFLSPITLLMAGAIWGRLELGEQTETDQQQGATSTDRRLGPARPAPRPALAGQGNGAAVGYTRQKVRHDRVKEPS
ncbi:MAG: hypothetical protein AAGE38_12805 [Pseudomonadota bacterium]